MRKRLVVVGGGAAGFFCALTAAALNPQLHITIVERTSKLLAKVRVSGGGRCNVTHSCDSISEMVKCYPRGGAFLKKAFNSFFTTDTINWFEARGVILKKEADGRMFPISDSSETIINCLQSEAANLNVQILLHKEVVDLHYVAGNPIIDRDYSPLNALNVSFKNGEKLEADFVCIAGGGFPKSTQFNWIRRIGHSIVEPVPSLFTFKLPNHRITGLMGISMPDVVVKIHGSKYAQRGPLLITHWGFSGPVILKLSAFAALELSALHYNCSIAINWLPAYNETTLREHIYLLRTTLGEQKIINRNPFSLPQRLWEFLLHESGVDEDARWSTLPLKSQNLVAKNLCTQVFHISGKTTFKEEFVTAGGISLNEINPNTMESRIVPGLYFAGEILNVDGITGGYNFQHAWSSGWIAGNAISLL